MSNLARAAQPTAAADRIAGLARAAAAPVCCAAVLLVLLATWVAGGGGGTVRPVLISVTLAAVPAPAPGAAARTAPVYLAVRNLSERADVLLSATSPDAARVVLTRAVTSNPQAAVGGLAVPARQHLRLSPFGADLVLIGPRLPAAGHVVLLRLRFKVAGTVTVAATVTPPGAP